MQITVEHLTADIATLRTQRDRLLADLNMVIGAIRYAETVKAALEAPDAIPVPTIGSASPVPEEGANPVPSVVD